MRKGGGLQGYLVVPEGGENKVTDSLGIELFSGREEAHVVTDKHSKLYSKGSIKGNNL